VNIKVVAVLLVNLILYPFTAFAQAPELFIPVTGSEEAIVQAKNAYFLKKELYFAKRHRIVRINTDLLLQDEKSRAQIIANLFDDVTFTYEVTERDIKPDQLGARLRARFTNPPTGLVRDFMNVGSGMTLSAAESLLDDVYGLSILGALYVHDARRDRFWPAYLFTNYAPGRPSSEVRPKKLPPSHATTYGFWSNILDPFSNDKYFLRSIPGDPQYHVVWQIDYSKTFAKPDHPGDEIMWPEERRLENESNRLAHAEFLLSLGPNPREATEHRDLYAYRDSLEDKSSKGN